MSQAAVAPPVSTSRALVPVDTVSCILCGPVVEWHYAQPALFRDCGYGAVTIRRVRGCECGNILIVDELTTNPNRYPAL